MAGLSFNCCPFFRSVYCAAPATLPGLGCLGLLLWGAPSSHKTGWTGSGSEAIGSGGFSITRDGSGKKKQSMRETSQDTCTPLHEGLGWEGPGMEQAALGVDCPIKILPCLSWVLATRAPHSPLQGRESLHLLNKAHRREVSLQCHPG